MLIHKVSKIKQKRKKETYFLCWDITVLFICRSSALFLYSMTSGSAMVTQRWLFIDQGSTNVPPTSPSIRVTEPSPGIRFNMTGDNIEVKITCQYSLQRQTITSLNTGMICS